MARIRIDPPQLTTQEIERFWSYVDKSPGHGPQGECWRWTRAVTGNGYGRFGPMRDGRSTHRLAFFLGVGRWPTGYVCHTCDWRRCCNPSHLFEGSHQDNANDAKTRHRYRHGESASWSKLTDSQVKEIRNRYQGKYGQAKAFAREYGVSRQTIWKIAKGVDWKHI